MKTTRLNHLANVEITRENCDEIIAESLELTKQAYSVKFQIMKSEALSMQIKRGIAAKREKQRKAEIN